MKIIHIIKIINYQNNYENNKFSNRGIKNGYTN